MSTDTTSTLATGFVKVDAVNKCDQPIGSTWVNLNHVIKVDCATSWHAARDNDPCWAVRIKLVGDTFVYLSRRTLPEAHAAIEQLLSK